MAVSEEKKELRRTCAALRSGISAPEKVAADAALCRFILSHSAFAAADLLLLFTPVRGEPDLLPLCEEAQRRGIAVAFPRCEGTQMTFHTVQDPTAMPTDRFGIPAPCATAPVPVTTSRTLCILPGLAAGRDGTRLGYGGGFYDRFLDTFTGITLFPVYDRLLFPTLPTEPTDHRVMHIVTEKGVLPPYV